MNIGDYVRWCNGDIAKIIDIKKYKTKEDEYYFDRVLDWHEDRAENDNIVYKRMLDLKDFKSSPNIIDLIEEHDILKIEEQKGVYTICEVETFKDPYTNYYFLGVRLDNTPVARKLYELNIKLILTHEMFESMEYKIGE